MCGICGFVTTKRYSEDLLRRMRDTMVHRGPDDAGSYITSVSNGYNLGLAHRRLAILDLSALGHQPMFSPDNRIAIVFNGEIYNFHEIRQELQGEYPFKSHCDTEVIIAAYLKWGIDCVSKFNGMFAIALYDREYDALYLVRDRIGKKPLYYWMDEGNIVFASELKPIMEIPEFPKIVDKEVIKKYLVHQYINAPKTIFENVYKLESGSVLSFHNGAIEVKKYWDVASVYRERAKNPIIRYEEAKEELKKLLIDSIRLRMIADVPVGSFLSGGYDSSLVTAIAQSISDVPVRTYSIGFYNEKYNEAKYAKEVAEHLGTAHTEYYIEEKEMLDLVQSIPTYYDEPFADSSQIPSMLVAQVARKDVTVVLSGDGGDEFFCGYNIYDTLPLAQKLDKIGAVIYYLTHNIMPELKGVPWKARALITNRKKETKTQLASTHYDNVANILHPSSESVKYQTECRYDVPSWQIKRMLLDMDTYLPGDILCKVDRATMKYSLEARCPILDYHVMECSYRILHKYKYFHGEKKYILKDIAYDYIPKGLLDRPKVGFGVPLADWLRGPLWEQLTDYANEGFVKRQEIFEPKNVQDFLECYKEIETRNPAMKSAYSTIAWSYFVFQQWYKTYFISVSTN